ncbi:MAG: ribbon-helix-helix domain-containing protein [Rhodospirillaceae bacterium]
MKRSITIAGHRTSVSLEDAFWDALHAIAQHQRRPLTDLVAEIDAGREGNLSSALRLYVLAWYQERSTLTAPPSRLTTEETS